MQQNESIDNSRPMGMYVLMLFLFVFWSFLGWNFGKVSGAFVGFCLASLVNVYAMRIKFD